MAKVRKIISINVYYIHSNFNLFDYRMIIEQLNCEREKLKYDVDTANNRAAMLAQEVDENHMRLEKSSADKIALEFFYKLFFIKI